MVILQDVRQQVDSKDTDVGGSFLHIILPDECHQVNGSVSYCIGLLTLYHAVEMNM